MNEVICWNCILHVHDAALSNVEQFSVCDPQPGFVLQAFWLASPLYAWRTAPGLQVTGKPRWRSLGGRFVQVRGLYSDWTVCFHFVAAQDCERNAYMPL